MRGFDEKNRDTKYDVDCTDLWTNHTGFIEVDNWVMERLKETGRDIHLKI